MHIQMRKTNFFSNDNTLCSRKVTPKELDKKNQITIKVDTQFYNLNTFLPRKKLCIYPKITYKRLKLYFFWRKTFWTRENSSSKNKKNIEGPSPKQWWVHQNDYITHFIEKPPLTATSFLSRKPLFSVSKTLSLISMLFLL